MFGSAPARCQPWPTAPAMLAAVLSKIRVIDTAAPSKSAVRSVTDVEYVFGRVSV